MKQPLLVHKKSKTFVIGAWGNVSVNIMTSKKQYDFFCEENNLELEPYNSFNGKAIYLEHKSGEVSFCMVLNSQDTSIICHESVHLAQYILDCVGVDTDVKNTECVAYLTENIFCECLKACGGYNGDLQKKLG